MRNIDNFRGLDYYGIGVLTREADRYKLRYLCDLSQEGIDLLKDFFGIPILSGFDKNWNRTVGGKKAIASVFLTREVLVNLCVFTLLHVDGYEYVLEDSHIGRITGFNRTDSLYYDRLSDLFETYKVYVNHVKRSGAL